MNVNANIRKWYENGGRKKIELYMEDVDGIFTSDTGHKKGVYGVFIITPHEKVIPMYIGEVGKLGRGFVDRLVEHSRYWIENPECYTGLKLSELENGYKYSVRILAVEDDDDKRYELEQLMIEEIKPYLQFNCCPKFKSDYRGFDLTIFRTYRRRAFLVARDGKYMEEDSLFVENIYKIKENVDFNKYRDARPSQKLLQLVQREMPKGSDVWRDVKSFVESSMGLESSSRGCRYSYLVKIVAAALEPAYNNMYKNVS